MKVQAPLIGKASGTSGGMVFQSYFGNVYTRSLPILFHYPDTPAQQKTQGLFYNILWQFQSIYNSFSEVIPREQRRGRNVYDILSHGIYQAAQTFPNAQATDPPRFFGTDSQQQVKLLPSAYQIAVGQDFVKVGFSLRFSLWRRRFTPSMAHIILIDYDLQSLMAASEAYANGSFNITFENVQKWQETDTIRTYVALSNPEFMSNFYRVSP